MNALSAEEEAMDMEMEGIASACAALPPDLEQIPDQYAPGAKTLVMPTANVTPLSTWTATLSPPRSKPRSRKELAAGAGPEVAVKRTSPSYMKTPGKTRDSFTKVLLPTVGKLTWHPERLPRRRGPSTPIP